MNADELKKQICIQLGVDPNKPPVYLYPQQVSEATTIKIGTLAHWRTTGRVNLPYVKIGGAVAYPFDGLVAYLLRRTYAHTGQEAA